MLEIDFYVFYPGNFLQHRAELAHAVITVFALSCNLDRFQDRVVGGLWKERVGWIGIVWSRRVHRFSYFTCDRRILVVSHELRLINTWLQPGVIGHAEA